jgi:hypothetical protein
MSRWINSFAARAASTNVLLGSPGVSGDWRQMWVRNVRKDDSWFVAPTFVVGEGSICFFEGRSQLSMFVAFLNELPSASAGGVLLSLISFRRMDRVAVNYVAIDDTHRLFSGG